MTSTEVLPGDRAGQIEQRGIEYVPDAERHGRPRELFALWAAPNVNYVSLTLGGMLTGLLGLSWRSGLVITVVGNLFWVLIGILAVSGTSSGTPSEVVSRTMFGVRGNRVNIAVAGWLLCVSYIALNLAAASLAAFALAGVLGWEPGTPGQVVLVIVIAAVTLALSVYGHATITRLYQPFSAVLAGAFAILGGFVLAHTDWDWRPAEPLSGSALVAGWMAGIAIIASGPLSYLNSADFARYLPRDTPARSVAGWTFLGAFLPSTLISGLGVLAGTVIDMADPQTTLRAILPAWFYPVFLLAVVLGLIANNAMTAYSSGLALQAIGVRLRRSVSVLLDGTVGVLVTLYALFLSTNFLDTVSQALQLSIVLVGPSVAIYVADILLRRNNYDGAQLGDETPGSPFWYTAGVNWHGAAALLAGMGAAALCADTDLYLGPVARALAGIDLSLPAGILVTGVLYPVLMRGRVRLPGASQAARRPVRLAE
ncbi:purine-cytosine permease-like protein [Actinoplanes octamycinicus]|uniref:Purine-cytosine permease-like protein n=1 Tax=Actinoplanes octamycinicus TaxID=135948 RepID=A0A7W7GXQ1_9ACTN|nr:cytosine permease [Actinoplanes octamycinicus]MBB4740172.1 purine-cytosine permease-like protein [Actinoplanes octamycinicus]GIE59569.1 allantoin permease [Actinoplanes octamycinicus]